MARSPRKTTIGTNPLDTVVPVAIEPAPLPKTRATFQLPGKLMERARDAVYWTPGATLAGIMEEALTAHLDTLEKRRGASFPGRGGTLKTGRPVK